MIWAQTRMPRSPARRGPAHEAGGVVSPVDALQGAVMGRLQPQIEPDFPEGRLAQDVQLLLVQAVRPGADGDSGQIGKSLQFPDHGAQALGRTVGIGEGLDVAQKEGGVPPRQEALPDLQILTAQAVATRQGRFPSPFRCRRRIPRRKWRRHDWGRSSPRPGGSCGPFCRSAGGNRPREDGSGWLACLVRLKYVGGWRRLPAG